MSNHRSRGVVYVATRREGYFRMACNSARSLRQFAPDLDITLRTDHDGTEPVETLPFTQIVHVTSEELIDDIEWANGLIDKVEGIAASPYEQTLFLDADTLVKHQDILRVFDWLDDHDVVIAECLLGESRSRRQFGRPMFNSGVIGFRKTPAVTALLQEWLALTRHFVELAARHALDSIRDLPGLSPAEQRRLIVTDQYSLAQVLTSEVNPFGLSVRILEPHWNHRGRDSLATDRPLVIDHSPALKAGGG